MDEAKRQMDYCGGLEECEKIFVKLASYWRSALIGLITLLGLGAGVWTWTWAEVKSDQSRQDKQIEEIQAAFNDIAYLRSQSNEILDNQKLIIRYFDKQVRR